MTKTGESMTKTWKTRESGSKTWKIRKNGTKTWKAKKSESKTRKCYVRCWAICIQVVIYILNAFAWCVAILALVSGFVIGIGNNTIRVDPHLKDFGVTTPATILIVYGVFLIIVATVGCFSSVTAGVIMSVLYVILILLYILFDIFWGYILHFSTTGIERFYNKTNESLYEYDKSKPKPVGLFFMNPDDYWEHLQSRGKCCGVESHEDWHSTNYSKRTFNIPDSCCNDDYNHRFCGIQVFRHPDSEQHSLADMMHAQGCMYIFPEALRIPPDDRLAVVGIFLACCLILCALLTIVIIFLVCCKLFRAEQGINNVDYVETRKLLAMDGKDSEAVFEHVHQGGGGEHGHIPQRIWFHGVKVHPENEKGDDRVRKKLQQRGRETNRKVFFRESGPQFIHDLQESQTVVPTADKNDRNKNERKARHSLDKSNNQHLHHHQKDVIIEVDKGQDETNKRRNSQRHSKDTGDKTDHSDKRHSKDTGDKTDHSDKRHSKDTGDKIDHSDKRHSKDTGDKIDHSDKRHSKDTGDKTDHSDKRHSLDKQEKHETKEEHTRRHSKDSRRHSQDPTLDNTDETKYNRRKSKDDGENKRHSIDNKPEESEAKRERRHSLRHSKDTEDKNDQNKKQDFKNPETKDNEGRESRRQSKDSGHRHRHSHDPAPDTNQEVIESTIVDLLKEVEKARRRSKDQKRSLEPAPNTIENKPEKDERERERRKSSSQSRDGRKGSQDPYKKEQGETRERRSSKRHSNDDKSGENQKHKDENNEHNRKDSEGGRRRSSERRKSHEHKERNKD